MDNLVEKIREAQAGNDTAMLEIVKAFEPSIKKFTRLLNNDEDCRSELILKLISLVKLDIHLDQIDNQSDGGLVSYIYKALYAHYILLSKKTNFKNSNEISMDDGTFVNLDSSNMMCINDTYDGILIETLKQVLTEKEFSYVYQIVFQGHTAEQVADKLGISKQAVNQSKNRALNKLRELYK